MSCSAARFRPDTRRVDSDIEAGSFGDFRRRKRLRLTELPAFRFWPRSPPPEDEPLLRDDSPEGVDGQATAAGGANNGRAGRGGDEREQRLDPAATALEQAELALFMCAAV